MFFTVQMGMGNFLFQSFLLEFLDVRFVIKFYEKWKEWYKNENN